MWDLIRSGGPVMIPIFLASVVGLAVFLERALALRRHRLVQPELKEAVETLSAGRDFSVAYAIASRKPGPFANVIRTGLDHAGDEWQIIRDAMQEQGRQEAVRLSRHLGILETVAAVAPLLGLLGTVLGMIRMFAAISLHGLGNPEHFSSGISEAMVTTAAGLFVGIPALIGFHWLEGRSAAIIFEMEVYATKVLDTLRSRGQAGGALPAAAIRRGGD